MKENTKTTRKEFISLGGVRPMKIADEFTSPPIPNDTPRLIIAYALIVLVVIILIGLGIFIYNEVQKEKSYADSDDVFWWHLGIDPHVGALHCADAHLDVGQQQRETQIQEICLHPHRRWPHGP